MGFAIKMPVRFADVDPAGIVFYPRYFEMLNALVEDWFAALGCDFRQMHLNCHMGVPTVRLEVDFLAPAELGDLLDLSLTVGALGTASCTLAVTFACAGEARLRAQVVLVCMDLTRKVAMPWPANLRPAMAAALDPLRADPGKMA